MAVPNFKSGVTAVSGPQNFSELIGIFVDLIKLAIPVVAGLALLVFFKGLAAFIAKSGDEKSHAEGKNLMIWGLIALFVMVSIWGIISVLSGEFGFGSSLTLPFLPQ
ncbi:MAG: hypothetical protein AAB695_00640 [Patescibacteria group bacterium]